MPKATCVTPDCTAPETGICILGNAVPGCPNYESADKPTSNVVSEITSESGRVFHSGTELGIRDAAQLSSSSYTHLIGLLGPYNAGKTCFILSLYLLASRNLLPDGYMFVRSLTLQGFEDRARGIRQWRGGPLPQQLAEHTRSEDPRRPGFLHMRIANERQDFNLLIPDLPGEWTSALIEQSSAAERWDFLRRADGLIIVLDGPELVGEERFLHVTRAKHLLERLKDSVRVDLSTPMVLLVSKSDELNLKRPQTLDEIEGYAAELGFTPVTILCASFSRTPNTIENGHGVFDALRYILNFDFRTASTETREVRVVESRSFSNYKYMSVDEATP